jgi:hypothetical protein
VPKPRQKPKKLRAYCSRILLAIGREWVPRRSATIAAQLRNQVRRESVLSDTWSLYLAVYSEMYDDRRTPNRALRAVPM